MIYTIEQIKEKCRKVFEKQDFVKEAYLFQHIKVQIQIESALLYSNIINPQHHNTNMLDHMTNHVCAVVKIKFP